MSKWQQTTLGKVLSAGGGKIQTGPFGSQLHASDYVDAGIPCIMPTNMKNNRVNLSGIAFIGGKDAQRLAHHLVQEGDIVYSRRGDVTQKALIGKAEVGYFCGTGCLLVRPGHAIDSVFLTYHLSTPINQSWIVKQAVGATMPNLNTAILSAVPLNVPPHKDQQKIAATLSALDAKIDCNNRINAELEAMAKTLYDYWFVQFDFPDANGKPYKSSGGKMVYNAMLKREIPAGWKVSSLNDLVELIKGNVSPSGVAENTPYVGLEHIGRKTITLSDWGASDSAASDKTVFKKNDILFGKIRPYFHKVTVAPFDGITSTDTIILRPKNRVFFGLALETVFADAFVEAATQSSTGSKMPRADWSVLQNYKVPVPDTDLLSSFNAVFEKALEKIFLSETENKKLTELRDWLLPLLMNGQVTVA